MKTLSPRWLRLRWPGLELWPAILLLLSVGRSLLILWGRGIRILLVLFLVLLGLIGIFLDLPGDRRFHDNAVVARSQRRWSAVAPLGFDVSLNSGFNQVVALLRYLSHGASFHFGPGRDCHFSAGVFSIAGATYDQTNHYFLARVPSGLVVEPAGHTEVERLVVLGHRWWSLADLDASDAIREPVAMVEVINRALALESHT